MRDPFESAGPLGDAYRQVDWSVTPLGPVSTWSPALRAAVGLILPSRMAVALLWGPEFVLLYNEAYIPILAEKHPGALGRAAKDVFPEIWGDIEALLTSVADGRGTVWIDDLRLLVRRNGMLQESYFTFSYSAVTGDDDTVEGVLDIVAESTQQVIGARRLALLGRLTSRLSDLDSPTDLLDRALPVLRAASDDVAAVDIVLPADLGGEATPHRRPPSGVVVDGPAVSVGLGGDPSPDAGLLVVWPNPHVPVDAAYHEFLGLVAAALEQSLNRVRVRQSERWTATLEREMSETLQRSLLTEPVRTAAIDVAVRYRAAAERAWVGGDWYDSFAMPDGSLTVVVGDVAGHDRHSAAAMAQVRSLARGVAYTLAASPALILSSVDAAMSGLAVNVHATAILALVESADGPDGAQLTLRWSNAGHPPPVLLRADGTARVLATSPETLLGTWLAPERTDHAIGLEPGSTVVFYTDGLVERRRTRIDDGIADLVNLLTGLQVERAEQVCDVLLSHFGHNAEDDLVLAVVHVADSAGNLTGPE